MAVIYSICIRAPILIAIQYIRVGFICRITIIVSRELRTRIDTLCRK